MRYRLLGNSGLRVSEAALKTVSDEIGRSMAQVALAWLRYRPVPVVPIIGGAKAFPVKGQSRELRPDPLSEPFKDA